MFEGYPIGPHEFEHEGHYEEEDYEESSVEEFDEEEPPVSPLVWVDSWLQQWTELLTKEMAHTQTREAVWREVMEKAKELREALLRKPSGAVRQLLDRAQKAFMENEVGEEEPLTVFRREMLRAYAAQVAKKEIAEVRASVEAARTILKATGMKDGSGLLEAIERVVGVTVEGGHRVTLVTAIPSDDEGAAVDRRYAALTQPLPLAMPPDLAQAQATLDQSFPWWTHITRAFLTEVADHNEEGVWISPALLVGPPGCGKSHYLEALARALEVPFLPLSVGGMGDNMALKGNARNWNQSRPSVLVQFIEQSRCANPLVILDELDKGGTSRHNGNVYDVLLQLLEPNNARRFFDECLLAQVDLSRVSFLATANELEGIPKTVRSRLTIHRVPEPSQDQLAALGMNLWYRNWQRVGHHPAYIPEMDEDWLMDTLRRNGIRDVRALKRLIEQLARQAKNTLPRNMVH